MAPAAKEEIREHGLTKSEFGVIWQSIRLKATDEYTVPPEILQVNGSTIGTLGNFSASTGKAKSKKTFNVSAIVAAALSNSEVLRYTAAFPDDKRKVLYIDTEQSEDDTIAIKNRVCTLAGIPYNVPQQRFKVARLRDTVQVDERYKQILQLMWEIKPDVVFIDGLLDIVNDYNAQDECSNVIRDLMAYSTALNMSMWCVLHENPMTDKLVGSLGSIAERKVTEVFVIRKHKAPHQDKRFNNFPSVFFEIKQTKARGKDQEDWYFVVEDRAMGWGVPVELGATNEEPMTKFDPRVLKEWITKRQYDVEWPATRTDIYSNIFKPEGVTDEGDQKEAMKVCLNSRFFMEQSKDEMKPGQKVPRLKINEELILPL